MLRKVYQNRKSLAIEKKTKDLRREGGKRKRERESFSFMNGQRVVDSRERERKGEEMSEKPLLVPWKGETQQLTCEKFQQI